jgi:hypothetical protein
VTRIFRDRQFTPDKEFFRDRNFLGTGSLFATDNVYLVVGPKLARCRIEFSLRPRYAFGASKWRPCGSARHRGDVERVLRQNATNWGKQLISATN